MADTDELAEDDSYVVLMTLHSAKGSGYPRSSSSASRDGVFPHLRCWASPDQPRGGAPPLLRRHHPGPPAPLPEPRLEPDALRRHPGTTRQSRFLEEIPRRSSRWSRAAALSAGAGRRAPSAGAAGRRGAAGPARPTAAVRRRSGATATTWSRPRCGRRPPAERGRRPRLRAGDDVRHGTFGEGVIIDLEARGRQGPGHRALPRRGEKRLLLSWAPLEKL